MIINKNLIWIVDCESIDWQELSNLYKIAPLGEKSPQALETVFKNSMFKYFIYDNFSKMKTAMAIFKNKEWARGKGLVERDGK